MGARSAKNSSATYIALIGDLVHSKEIQQEDRSALQNRLREHFETLNQQGSDGLRARLLLTLGDEFQGLFEATPSGAQRLIDTIGTTVAECRPTKARFGIGIGSLSTELRAEALGMDGPCFHRAREALVTAKEKELPCWLVHLKHPHEEVWGLLASSLLATQEGWTGPQLEAVRLHRRGSSGEEIANRLGITPGAVSQRLSNANWKFVRQATGALVTDLSTIAARGENELAADR